MTKESTTLRIVAHDLVSALQTVERLCGSEKVVSIKYLKAEKLFLYDDGRLSVYTVTIT